VATLRERRTGVSEISVFTGRDADGRPTQISKTVRGTKRGELHADSGAVVAMETLAEHAGWTQS
jgi:hypothetical protein